MAELKSYEVKLDVKLDVSDDTMQIIMRLLEVWYDAHPDKKIVCEREICDDGFKHHVYIEE